VENVTMCALTLIVDLKISVAIVVAMGRFVTPIKIMTIVNVFVGVKRKIYNFINVLKVSIYVIYL
jgi:hypothetical protein